MSSTDGRGPGDDAGAPAGTRPGVALRRDRLRATVGRIAAGQVEQLREVAGLVAECAAEKLVERATQLVGVLPDTLAALEAGRIDLPGRRCLWMRRRSSTTRLLRTDGGDHRACPRRPSELHLL